MPSNSEVLVLVANEQSGKLCANSNGSTRVLRSIERATPVNDADPQPSAHDRLIFASQLMMALTRDVSKTDYDGVIIFAEASMMEQLTRVQTSTVSRQLIARIVNDRSEPSVFSSDGMAKADFSFKRAAQ